MLAIARDAAAYFILLSRIGVVVKWGTLGVNARAESKTVSCRFAEVRSRKRDKKRKRGKHSCNNFALRRFGC